MAVKLNRHRGTGEEADFCASHAKPAKDGFNKYQFIIMALGNIIGSGIFLASGTVINIAGIWTPLAYLLGGFIMICEVSFIVEMSVANPASGSFKVHTQQIFGRWWGYVVGWMFWASGVLGMAGEVTACALFMHFWLPAVPLWVFSLFFALMMTIINLNDVKGLSIIELWLASVKIATLLIFIIMGAAVVFGLEAEGAAAGLRQFAGSAGTGLTGISDLMAVMILILFAYTGTGIIGLAVAETKKPELIVPQASKMVTLGVTALYTIAAVILVLLLPAGKLDVATSPFIAILGLFAIPYGADVLNFILVTAALSSLNSQIYSSSRMLLSLAEHGEAPRAAAVRNRKGVPVAAVLLSGAVLVGTSLASYILPEKVFIYTISASGILALVNWMSISATHYFYRRALLKNCPEKLRYKAPGYPYLSWFIFALILAAVISAPLYPDQIPGLVSGVAILFIIGISYYFLPANRS